MSTPLLAIVGCIYTAVAIDFLRQGNAGMFVAFLAYAVANGGFIWASHH